MLGEERTHEQAAVAAALDCELLRVRPFLLDQICRGRREIIEHILLLRQVSGLVPFFAKLTAAPDVRHNINAAAIEPETSRKTKRWRLARAVAAVAIE